MSSTEGSESIFRGINWEEWPRIRKKVGYPEFYDRLFEYERSNYQNYLNNYEMSRLRRYNSELLRMLRTDASFMKPIIEEIIKYICEKTGIDTEKKEEQKHQSKEQQIDPESCFSIPEHEKIDLDDYVTYDNISEKIRDVMIRLETLPKGHLKYYLAYKSIELGVKLISFRENNRLQQTLSEKIKEFIKEPEMACVKPKLEELYDILVPDTSHIQSKCQSWEFSEIDIKEFIYFGKTPSWIVKNINKEDPEDYTGTLTLDGENYKYHYFIWRREGDPNIKRADKNEIVTRENFKNYARFDSVGWSVKQLRTFFNTNILPIILEKCNININTNLPIYKKIIDNALYKDRLNMLIYEYIQSNTIDIDMYNISEIKRSIDESKDLENTNAYIITRYMNDILYNFIARLMIARSKVQRSLQKKIKKIKNKIDKTRSQYKYKWQIICSSLKTWDIEQLRELAVIENIDNYTMKSKRELCKEFQEILQKKLDEQRRNRIRYIPEPEPPKDPNDKQLNELFKRHIQNNLTDSEKKHKQRYPQQYSKKCQNSDSIFGDDVNDIKPEFFFTYEHNNKIFCEDIRVLYDQIILSEKKGEEDTLNPYDRTPLSQELVQSIKKAYNKLNDTMISLEDEEEQQEKLSLHDILTSKTADLSGLFFHHAPIENFINSDTSIFREFLMYLEDDNIISEREVEHILKIQDLQSQKIAAVDLLTIKIRNDPYIVDGISSMASNITDIYNSVFTDELQSESDGESSNEESDTLILQRKAMILISKLRNLPVNHATIINANTTQISDFIRDLVETNLLSVNILHEWSLQGLISETGLVTQPNIIQLKIKLLQYLIDTLQEDPEKSTTIGNSINKVFG